MTRPLDKPAAALSSSLGFGYSPIVPGTVGTLPAVAIFLVVAVTVPREYQTVLLAVLFVATCFLSILLGPWAERYWGTKDPRRFTLDEVAGFFMTVLLFRGPDLLLTTVWAFTATRFFDIVKPPPAAQMERLPAGWGILLDDLIASLYAVAFLHVSAWFFPRLLGV